MLSEPVGGIQQILQRILHLSQLLRFKVVDLVTAKYSFGQLINKTI
jgi:hypothetical protein